MIVIAEIGTSHNGSLQKAKELIDGAGEAGADCVKFQWVYADEILHPNTGFVSLPTGNISLYERFRELEVGADFYAECLSYAHSRGLLFACSPFGLRSLEELLVLNPDAVKIASPEVNHIPLLNKLSQCYGQVPLILSSGVSRLGDIETAVDILTKGEKAECTKKGFAPLTLLHCITSYPAPEEEYNVKCVKTLSDIFGIPTGISDHSLTPVLVPALTAAMGGTVIEKHITLSRKTDGLDDPVALEVEQFAQMVHAVHQVEAVIQRWKKEELALGGGNVTRQNRVPEEAVKEIVSQLADEFGMEKIQKILGSGIKRLAKSETANYGRTNRSLHYLRAIKKGQTISKNDIAVLRTEKVLSPGIAPVWEEKIVGSRLTRDVESGEGVQWEHFLTRED